MKPAAGLVLVLPLVIAGCLASEPLAERTQRPLVDGTPEGVGVLALLNDAATTFAVLDDEVPLDRRAAENLVAHRNGTDGAFGTADDDRFGSIDEVDDVRWVGQAAIERLVAYADAQGFVPAGDDVLGSYDGVAFTVVEAERALRAVNEYSDGVLRVEIGLDSRAVRSIIAARPISSMPALAELYWLGPVTMQRLHDYVVSPPPGERADCRGDFECGADERCTGFPNDGTGERGKCYPIARPPGAEASCSAETPCNEGLVCLGELAWGEGFCVPAWQRGRFDNITVRHIPDSGEVVATTTVVYGLATVPVDIALYHDIRHSDPDSLRVTLRSNNGDEAVMWDGPNETGDMPAVLTRNCCIPSDDYVNGRWTVLIENVVGRGTGTSHGWTLEITSQWD